MFTTGSKLLIGSALVAGVCALVYGVTRGGSLGTIGLISAAAGLALLAGINAWVRDSNVSAMDHESFATSPAAQATAQPSLWPLVAGIGVTAMALGMATFRPIFVLGMIATVAAAIEWMVQGWSERASAERPFNAGARNRMIDPLELPVAGAAGAAIVVFAFSRVMLGSPSKAATVVIFALVAALLLAVATVLSSKRQVSKGAMTGTFGIVAAALVTGGAVYGLNGEREIEQHHTTAYIAERNECGDEETEADERASQTVSSKSNVAAEVIFDGASLRADLPGYDGTSSRLTLPRANPNHVMFRNESDEPARLVIDMHPRRDDNNVPLGPERVCTAIVEEGGVQFLTLVFAQSSRTVPEPYALVVPGTEVELEVVVP